MQRLKNSWELGKISWSVLKSDRTLAWFPVVSAIVSLVVFGVFAGLIAATSFDDTNDSLEPMGYVLVFAAYVALAFVGTYFLGALVHAANQRLNGQDTKFGDSIGAANAKIHRILPWAFVTATVSVVLQAIEERLGWFGVLIARLLGAAWAVVTFLTVPVIMLEDLGPIAALKRSGHLLKQTWGENLGAQAGFSILGLVAMLPAALLIAIAASADNIGTWVVLGGITAVWLIIVVVVLSAMSGIYRTALYRFAVDGTAPPAFAGSNLGDAFGERKSGGGWLS